ncbi:MAG: PfkB family carbohydrate kinase [Woeseiaceae bacterium]|nr:PfkB family carbohydrate kinase [Woeseiaceae bacterium]
MAKVFCIGHAVQDFVFSVDAMPSAAEKYRASGFETLGGGPAATAAVAISRLGGASQLATRVGDDLLANLIALELEHYGVDCTLVRRMEGRQSSVSAVLVDGAGERTIVNYLDSSMDPDPQWLDAYAPVDAEAILADTRWPEGALLGLQLARSIELPAILDADLPVPKDGELVRTATHVAFSARGLSEFSGIDNPAEAIRWVSAQTAAWCCVTLGPEGVLAIENDQLTRLPAFKVSVRDTLGAGDVWHGAFALALAEGQSTTGAIRFASAAAALKVQNGGGRAGCPVRDEVDRFLQQHATENET